MPVPSAARSLTLSLGRLPGARLVSMWDTEAIYPTAAWARSARLLADSATVVAGLASRGSVSRPAGKDTPLTGASDSRQSAESLSPSPGRTLAPSHARQRSIRTVGAGARKSPACGSRINPPREDHGYASSTRSPVRANWRAMAGASSTPSKADSRPSPDRTRSSFLSRPQARAIAPHIRPH